MRTRQTHHVNHFISHLSHTHTYLFIYTKSIFDTCFIPMYSGQPSQHVRALQKNHFQLIVLRFLSRDFYSLKALSLLILLSIFCTIQSFSCLSGFHFHLSWDSWVTCVRMRFFANPNFIFPFFCSVVDIKSQKGCITCVLVYWFLIELIKISTIGSFSFTASKKTNTAS